MEIITLTKENLASEHICCAMAKEVDCQVKLKKEWLANRLDEGLIFKKINVRGKVFIEYMPAEYAWCPIDAKGYMFINCLWVSGRYKGQGYGDYLLKHCIEDAKLKKKKGLIILTSSKKRPYLADKAYLTYKGFQVVDDAAPYYELMALQFKEEEEKPCFKACAKKGRIEEQGLVLFYSGQCPFNGRYVDEIKQVAKQKNVKLSIYHYMTGEEARAASVPATTYALFYNGEFVTHEVLSEKKFEVLLVKLGLI